MINSWKSELKSQGKYLAAHPEEANGTPVEKHCFTQMLLIDIFSYKQR